MALATKGPSTTEVYEAAKNIKKKIKKNKWWK